MNLTGEQKRTIFAAWLGWTLDAFDFFLLTFLLKDIAKEFGVEVSAVAYALFLTLAMRFVGAFIFGRIGDKWGRKPALMLDILCYSIIGALAAFSPKLTIFLVLRALFGIAMGGERGLGSSVAMESIRRRSAGRCRASGRAAIHRASSSTRSRYGLLYGRTFGDYAIGWRAMFVLSVLPAFVVLFIRSRVPQSPAFEASQVHKKPHLWATVAEHKGLVLYMVLLMLCFNLFSHATQDLYPTFLQKQHNFDPAIVSWITIVANLGAIAGASPPAIGRRRSDGSTRSPSRPSSRCPPCRSGPMRRRQRCSRSAPSSCRSQSGRLGRGPAHLNELTPGAARATIPAFVYQAGNFLASYNGPFQARIADANGGDYSYALALVAGVVAVAMIVVVRFSPERRGHVLVAH